MTEGKKRSLGLFSHFVEISSVLLGFFCVWYFSDPEFFEPIIKNNIEAAYNVLFYILIVYLLLQLCGIVFTPTGALRLTTDAFFSSWPFAVTLFAYAVYQFFVDIELSQFYWNSMWWIAVVTFIDLVGFTAVRAKILESDMSHPLAP